MLGVEPPGAFVFDINNDCQRRDSSNVVERPLQRIQQQQVSNALSAERDVTGQASDQRCRQLRIARPLKLLDVFLGEVVRQDDGR